MRLQLTVQRHGLPPVQVLWTLASAVRPPILAAGNSITISQFLEQVNEVLPLESEDWGLEDYSVEVRGFECLHFSELNQVLKEDDEVWWVAQFGLIASKKFQVILTSLQHTASTDSGFALSENIWTSPDRRRWQASGRRCGIWSPFPTPSR